MNGRLPRDIDGRELVRALQRIGFAVNRRSGSPAVLLHADGREVVVPVHPGRSLALGTLRQILRRACLTTEELQELL